MEIQELQKRSDGLCKEIGIKEGTFKWVEHEGGVLVCYIHLASSASVESNLKPDKRLLAVRLKEAHEDIMSLCKDTITKLKGMLNGNANPKP
jgi:hypothetical protein